MTSSRFLSLRGLISSAALLLGFALASPFVSAQSTVVLDDFSTDKFSADYVQKDVSGFGPGGWVVMGGLLQPETQGGTVGGYAAFAWTQNALQNVGDSFSIDLLVSTDANGGNAGLSVWTSNTTTFDRVSEPRLSYGDSGYTFIGDASGDVWFDSVRAVDGPATLTITLSGRTATDTLLTYNLTDNSGALDSRVNEVISGYLGVLYVGPSAYNASGGNIAFDNLTYTAASTVPEPATTAVFFGVMAIGLGLWRKLKRPAVLGAKS